MSTEPVKLPAIRVRVTGPTEPVKLPAIRVTGPTVKQPATITAEEAARCTAVVGVKPVTPEVAVLRALQRLADAKASRDRLEASIAEQVRLLRIARASWEAIGDALGVSKQAVHQRFGSTVHAHTRTGA